MIKERKRKRRINTLKDYEKKGFATIEAEMARIRLNCARERYEISKRHSIKEYVV